MTSPFSSLLLSKEFERLAVALGLSRASKTQGKLAKHRRAKGHLIADQVNGYFGQDTRPIIGSSTAETLTFKATSRPSQDVRR